MRSPARYLFLSMLLAALLACSSTPLPEQNAQAANNQTEAAQTQTAVAVIVKARKANVRNAPSQYASVLATVNKGALLSLLTVGPSGSWYRVRDSRVGVEGWIHASTIALLRPAESTPTSTPRPRVVAPSVSGRSYVNVDGVRVPSPVFTDKKPAGATAHCRDGSYSFSQHRQGTCSHHGGVAQWF